MTDSKYPADLANQPKARIQYMRYQVGKEDEPRTVDVPAYWCPVCKHPHAIATKKTGAVHKGWNGAMWEYNEDINAPTFHALRPHLLHEALRRVLACSSATASSCAVRHVPDTGETRSGISRCCLRARATTAEHQAADNAGHRAGESCLEIARRRAAKSRSAMCT
jgi:hypothetical protein